jgi:hypothetical protein
MRYGQSHPFHESFDRRRARAVFWSSSVSFRFWEVETGNLRREAKAADRASGDDLRIYSVCFAPQGDLIATAHLDGTVRIWQADEMLLRTQFDVKGRFLYGAMVFSPDGLWLATGARDGTVDVWDPLTARSVWNVGRHQSQVYTVSFGRNLDRVDEGEPYEEIQRLRRMKTLLVNKDQTIESAVAVRRAVSVLAQIGTPDAIRLLRDLAAQDPKKDVARFASAAVDRLTVFPKP